jgi:hypothetical protein
MTRTGAQLGITGSSTGSSSISASLVYPAFATRFFIPKTANGLLDLAVSITQGGPQALTATPGMAAASMGVPGTVIIRTAQHNFKGVNQSTFMAGTNTLVMVPVSIGGGGQFISTFTVLGASQTLTVDFYDWTPGTQVFTGLTAMGVAALPNVTAAGSWALTAGGGGTVTLVAPIKISIDGGLAHSRRAMFATLKLYFVPEPSTLLLLTAGAVGLALVGFRKG